MIISPKILSAAHLAYRAEAERWELVSLYDNKLFVVKRKLSSMTINECGNEETTTEFHYPRKELAEQKLLDVLIAAIVEGAFKERDK
jgi:hypothetical protein